MHCASEMHLKVARRVLRYINGTTNFDIKFKKNKDFKLLEFSDSDWTESIDDMKSTSGYCFNLVSEVFSWSSKKQETGVQSIAEAEFIVATVAINQALWIRKILSDLILEQKKDTKIFVDHQATITISHCKTEKYIDDTLT